MRVDEGTVWYEVVGWGRERQVLVVLEPQGMR